MAKLGKMNKTRFLIIGYQRSGTTVLSQIINGHPNVSALDGELNVHPFFSLGIRIFTGGYASENAVKNGHSLLFNALTSECLNDNTLALGAKTVCNAPKLANKIVKTVSNHLNDIKIILIRREDLVAQYGSMREQKRTGVSHSWYKNWKGQTAKKIKVNELLFKRYVLVVLATYDELRRLSKNNQILELSYEAFCQDNDSIYRDMLSFLDLPYEPPSWLSSKKVLPAPDRYVSNYKEMQMVMQRIKNDYEKGLIASHVDIGLKIYTRLYNMLDLVGRFRAIRNRRRRRLINQGKIQE